LIRPWTRRRRNVADLAGGDLAGGLAEQPGEQPTQVAVAEPVGASSRNTCRACSRAGARAVAQAQPGDPCPISVVTGSCTAVKASAARIVLAESLDALQARLGTQ
jgi:hypothetical protein